jgi:outer membrane protein assembly factor BamB
LQSVSGVVKVDAETGTLVWTAPTRGVLNPGAPVVSDAGLLVTEVAVGLSCLDLTDGAPRWSLDVHGSAPFPMGWFRTVGHPVFAEPCVAHGDRIVLPGLDGTLRVVDLRSGSLVGGVTVRSPVAAPATAVDGIVVVVGVDGTVTAIDLDG